MTEEPGNSRRRRFLTAITSILGLAGAGTLAASFVASMRPSARARAAGAPVEVDISRLRERQMLVVAWRGKPVWIMRRSQQMLDDLGTLRQVLVDPDSEIAQQPVYAQNEFRSIRPDILVVLGVGSKFDLAGRVYKNVPAPTNLEVPPHSFLSDSRILIGTGRGEGTV